MIHDIEEELHLRWLLSWMRDLLQLAEDLIAYGRQELVHEYIDFHELVLATALNIQGLMSRTNFDPTVSRDRLRGGDPDFPSVLLPRRRPPDVVQSKEAMLSFLRRFNAAVDPIERATWQPAWKHLAKMISKISSWNTF